MFSIPLHQTIETLPSINHLLSNKPTFHWKQHVDNSCQQVNIKNSPNEEMIDLLRMKIFEMEELIKKQNQIIQDLKNENNMIRNKQQETTLNPPHIEEPIRKKVKQTQFQYCETTFTIKNKTLQNYGCDNQENLTIGKLDEFKVKWKGKDYILIDAFKNRSKILNYYIPLFQIQFPNTICKLVLNSEDYKLLFKENPKLSTYERKHAWRISIFTLEFYNFILKQI